MSELDFDELFRFLGFHVEQVKHQNPSQASNFCSCYWGSSALISNGNRSTKFSQRSIATFSHHHTKHETFGRVPWIQKGSAINWQGVFEADSQKGPDPGVHVFPGQFTSDPRAWLNRKNWCATHRARESFKNSVEPRKLMRSLISFMKNSETLMNSRSMVLRQTCEPILGTATIDKIS